MKISRRQVASLLDAPLPPLADLVNVIGAQIGAVEQVEELGERYARAIIVEIVEAQPIEGSDHLQRCLINDDGSVSDTARTAEGFIEVVCGAANARVGIRVVWLPPGAVVPSSVVAGEPFTLTVRIIRGSTSNGMLASAKELAIGDAHEGILELESTAVIGLSVSEAFELDDEIITIENKMFTHRPDLFGQLGVAREIAGSLGQHFESPAWYMSNEQLGVETDTLPLKIQNELPHQVERYMAVSLSGVDGQEESPLWLKTQLSRVGIRPIGLIVDITNYMMQLTAQPLHAYDYDKVVALGNDSNLATLIVRNPRANEQISLLNGKTITPQPEAIMIATEHQSVGLAGIMGGQETEVDASTKNIILEVATFDMYSIRKTSMRNGIFSDAVTRFNKGQSPLQNQSVLKEAVRLLKDLSKTRVVSASAVVDLWRPTEIQKTRNTLHPPVRVSASFINSRLGLLLTIEAMAVLLLNVEFQVSVLGDDLEISAPFWRTDIELREDIVEEIGRLHGFDNLPLKLPLRQLSPVARNARLTLKQQLRSTLAAAGANELLCYSFVHGQLLENVGQDSSKAYRLMNALSPELQYYRLSLSPSLLTHIHQNLKAGFGSFALFEIGTGHCLPATNGDAGASKSEPVESERLSLVFAASDTLVKISKDQGSFKGSSYFQAAHYLRLLLKSQGIDTALRFEAVTDASAFGNFSDVNRNLYASGRRAHLYIGDDFLGDIGEYTATVSKKLKLPEFCAGFEIDLAVVQAKAVAHRAYQSIPRYPEVVQDICLQVTLSIHYQDLYNCLSETLKQVSPQHTRQQLEPVDIYIRDEQPDRQQITFRLRIASYQKTMTDQEVAMLLQKLSIAAKERFDAVTI